jgi:hypothetical protein
MTIEQYINPFLKEQLQNKLNDYNVLVVTDLTHFNLTDEKSVIFVVKTGQSALSAIKGNTEITTPTQINFKCYANEQENILGLLTDLIYELNTTIYQTKDEKYNLELLLNTPTLILTQHENVKNGTKLVSYGVFTMTSYATDGKLVIYDKYLNIDNNYYFQLGSNIQVVENVAYNYANSPTSNDLGEEKYQNKVISFSITLAKVVGALTDYLEDNRYTLENKVFKYLKVKHNADPYEEENVVADINCIVTRFSETEQSGVPTISLELKGII